MRNRIRELAADWRSDDGALVNEAAILFPMIFSITLFVVQFGMFYYADMVVEQAAQHGVREAALNGPAAAGTVENRATRGTEAVLNNVRGGIQDVRINVGSNTRAVSVRVRAHPPYVFNWMRGRFDFEVDGRAYAEFEQFRNAEVR